jgi:hypothetical protein
VILIINDFTLTFAHPRHRKLIKTQQLHIKNASLTGLDDPNESLIPIRIIGRANDSRLFPNTHLDQSFIPGLDNFPSPQSKLKALPAIST